MTKHLLSYTVFLVLLLSPVRLAAQDQTSLPPDKIKKVEAVILSEMSRQKIPAVSVAIAAQLGKLLKEENVRRMWTPQKMRDGQATGGGLGWALTERNGQREVWHDGGQQRVSTILYILPDQKFALALMTNLEEVTMLEFAHKVADAMR